LKSKGILAPKLRALMVPKYIYIYYWHFTSNIFTLCPYFFVSYHV